MILIFSTVLGNLYGMIFLKINGSKNTKKRWTHSFQPFLEVKNQESTRTGWFIFQLRGLKTNFSPCMGNFRSFTVEVRITLMQVDSCFFTSKKGWNEWFHRYGFFRPLLISRKFTHKTVENIKITTKKLICVGWFSPTRLVFGVSKLTKLTCRGFWQIDVNLCAA